MRSTGLRPLLVAAVVLAAVVGLPSAGAQAAKPTAQPSGQCQWLSSDLPLPDGFTSGLVSGSDGGTRLSGYARTDKDSRYQGVVWENSMPRLLGMSGFDSTTLSGVNVSGVAAGNASSDGFGYAVRNAGSGYEWLQPLARADKINRAGLISGPGNNRGEVVVWRPDQPGSPRTLTVPNNEAVGLTGIDGAGRVIASTTIGNSYVWSASGIRTQIAPVFPGGWAQVWAIDAGRIVGRSGDGSGAIAAVEWDVAGRVVWTLPTGTDAVGVNTNTMIVGTYTSGTAVAQPAVWQDGQFAGALVKPVNASRIQARVITDDGVVAGSYRTTGTTRDVPAVWTCG